MMIKFIVICCDTTRSIYEEEKINIWSNNRPNAIKLFKERFTNDVFIKITSPYEEKRK